MAELSVAEKGDTISMDIYTEDGEVVVMVVVRIGNHRIGQAEAAQLEDAMVAAAKIATRWLEGR